MSALELKCLNAAENEFLAEETLIEITSGMNHPVINLISGNFGPFYAGFPVHVPLWLAINLKNQGKCRINIPDWLTVESLEQHIINERSLQNLGPLPFHYIEIAHLLLTNAKDDIKSPDKVSILINDIENLRMDRIKIGMMSIADTINNGQSVICAALNNVAAMEIYTMKRFFLKSMDTMLWLCPPSERDQQQEEEEQQQNRANSSTKRFKRKQQTMNDDDN